MSAWMRHQWYRLVSEWSLREALETVEGRWLNVSPVCSLLRRFRKNSRMSYEVTRTDRQHRSPKQALLYITIFTAHHG